MNLSLERLLADRRLSIAFAEFTDFEAQPPDAKVEWAHFSDRVEATPVGADGAGGLFLLRPDSLVVHASS